MTFSTLLILSLSCYISLSAAQLTRDSCQNADGCDSPRQCYDLVDIVELDQSQSCPRSCRCFPPTIQTCSSSEQCSNGEVCARTKRFPFVCSTPDILTTFAGQAVRVEDAPGNPLIPVCPLPDGAVMPRRKAIVEASCVPGGCANGLSCVVVPETNASPDPFYSCCTNSRTQNCTCFSTDFRPMCNHSGECNQREICAFGPILPQQCYSRNWINAQRRSLRASLTIIAFSPTPSASASTSVSPAPSPSEEPEISVSPAEEDGNGNGNGDGDGDGEVCFDAEMLSQYQHGLVYDRHRLANVLCDSMGSCATNGHIVVYNERSMMMGSYCALVGCARKVIRVNSPTWRRGVLVKTNTKGLSFTAFAARYQTRLEESVLTGLVRAGL